MTSNRRPLHGEDTKHRNDVISWGGLNTLFHTEYRDSQDPLLSATPEQPCLHFTGRRMEKIYGEIWAAQSTGPSQGTLTAKRSHQTYMHMACRSPGTINETGPALGHVSRRCHWMPGTNILQTAKNRRKKKLPTNNGFGQMGHEKVQILQIF